MWLTPYLVLVTTDLVSQLNITRVLHFKATQMTPISTPNEELVYRHRQNRPSSNTISFISFHHEPSFILLKTRIAVTAVSAQFQGRVFNCSFFSSVFVTHDGQIRKPHRDRIERASFGVRVLTPLLVKNSGQLPIRYRDNKKTYFWWSSSHLDFSLYSVFFVLRFKNC